MTEDEMVGQHHKFNGHIFEQTLGDGEGQGGLACCSPRVHKELDTNEQLNNNSIILSTQQQLFPEESPCTKSKYLVSVWEIDTLSDGLKKDAQALEQDVQEGSSLAVQCLRLHAPSAGGSGSIFGHGTRSHVLQLSLHAATKDTTCLNKESTQPKKKKKDVQTAILPGIRKKHLFLLQEKFLKLVTSTCSE